MKISFPRTLSLLAVAPVAFPGAILAFPLPGTPAPSFEASAVFPDKDNPAGTVKTIKLADYIGKQRVLLVTYPKNCTFICPTELLALKGKVKEFHHLGYEILVLSTDEASLTKDKEASHQAWRLKSENANKGKPSTPLGLGNADFIMVADPGHTIIRSYGVEGTGGLALRATFFIDLKGKVRIAEVNDNNIGRDVDDWLRKAAAMKFVEEHEGMVTPEGWQPGEPGMKPTHKGVREHIKKQ